MSERPDWKLLSKAERSQQIKQAIETGAGSSTEIAWWFTNASRNAIIGHVDRNGEKHGLKLAGYSYASGRSKQHVAQDGALELTIFELTEDTCRNPLWGYGAPSSEKRYCGLPVRRNRAGERDSSYCPDCARMNTYPVATRAPRKNVTHPALR